MSAAGRRVKLDLFAEPSGDVGASSTQGKVGENCDTENSVGSPNSPSSSGNYDENFQPTLLGGIKGSLEISTRSFCPLDRNQGILSCCLSSIVMTNWMTIQMKEKIEQLPRTHLTIC
ncbi:uncharacterized protein LOC111370746 isoform X3 [Olea europaea var. sylvestris]|uniref:uncharacterized protein LOC111370746 isoform X3 n=1 Tax=Olea europaea var. sylvestris TaxID=158386 RepID=UPI000C1D88A6|nr:uncharacterized protein LOC111370746 isoform X3 [Olea europaea var. sylvestris]